LKIANVIIIIIFFFFHWYHLNANPSMLKDW
jgi:hypothetical protein